MGSARVPGVHQNGNPITHKRPSKLPTESRAGLVVVSSEGIPSAWVETAACLSSTPVAKSSR